MSKDTDACALVREHGQTFAEECGIDLRRATAQPLLQLLCASLLYSARISATIATQAARGLREGGLDTAGRMRGSSHRERARLLDEAGYARYDERTATTLGDLAGRIAGDCDGDLRGCARRPVATPRPSGACPSRARTWAT